MIAFFIPTIFAAQLFCWIIAAFCMSAVAYLVRQ
jgi:hypothetical protein